jgi:preprotein translocase SecE subunit
MDNSKSAKKVQKTKKPNIFKRMGAKIKDVFSELKKVSWPTFSKVVKQTGIVLAVVAIFLVVITAFDFGLLQFLKAVS